MMSASWLVFSCASLILEASVNASRSAFSMISLLIYWASQFALFLASALICSASTFASFWAVVLASFLNSSAYLRASLLAILVSSLILSISVIALYVSSSNSSWPCWEDDGLIFSLCILSTWVWSSIRASGEDKFSFSLLKFSLLIFVQNTSI